MSVFFLLPLLLLPTPLLPSPQISPLKEKVKEGTNFHFETDLLKRPNTKSGIGRTKLPKEVNGEQNTDREKERQIDESKTESVVTGAAKGRTPQKSPPTGKAMLPRRITLLYQRIGNKQDGGETNLMGV